MENNEWIIDIKVTKKMVDPVINRIIRGQLSQEICSAMFLVGGFNENMHLQTRIKQEFQHRVKTTSVPNRPIAAIAHGPAMYGLSLRSNSNIIGIIRILKYTYGTD